MAEQDQIIFEIQDLWHNLANEWAEFDRAVAKMQRSYKLIAYQLSKLDDLADRATPTTGTSVPTGEKDGMA